MSNEEQEERDAMEVIILMCFRWLLPDKTILYGEEIVEFLILAGGLQKEPVWNGFQTISARWHVISHWYEISDYVHVSIFDFYHVAELHY